MSISPSEKPQQLDFQVLAFTAEELGDRREAMIENASTPWMKTDTRDYVTLARITILPQDFNDPAAVKRCEYLFFTPWHSLKDHQPLGGINRMKLGVYNASSEYRRLAKEPTMH